jgi:hypothetical protein
MSFLSSVMIESAFKNYNFCSFSELSDFTFFPENFSKTITNKTKKLRISITKTHRKKNFHFFPNFPIFRATSPIFFP